MAEHQRCTCIYCNRVNLVYQNWVNIIWSAIIRHVYKLLIVKCFWAIISIRGVLIKADKLTCRRKHYLKSKICFQYKCIATCLLGFLCSTYILSFLTHNNIASINEICNKTRDKLSNNSKLGLRVMMRGNISLSILPRTIILQS